MNLSKRQEAAANRYIREAETESSRALARARRQRGEPGCISAV